MQWLYPALLTAYVGIDAVVQGRITKRNREYVPMSEQPAVSFDHHILMVTLYLLLAVAVFLSDHRLEWLSFAALLRLALFDILLNATKGDPLLALGSSANTDRFLASLHLWWASIALRVACLAGAAYMLWRLA